MGEKRACALERESSSRAAASAQMRRAVAQMPPLSGIEVNSNHASFERGIIKERPGMRNNASQPKVLSRLHLLRLVHTLLQQEQLVLAACDLTLLLLLVGCHLSQVRLHKAELATQMLQPISALLLLCLPVLQTCPYLSVQRPPRVTYTLDALIQEYTKSFETPLSK